MNLFDFLSPAAGAGATLSTVMGFAAVAAGVGAKYWQDRDLLRPQMAERRDVRREAREQTKALGKRLHKPRFTPGAGQFALRNRDDPTDVNL
jgi:hypothetical protein